MKNFKINAFDSERLFKIYNSIITDKITGDKESITEHYSFFNNIKINYTNELIFNIYNFSSSDYVIISGVDDLTSQLIAEDEVLRDPNEPAEGYDDIYITEDGVLCSGRCIDFSISCMNDDKKDKFIYKKYNRNTDYSIIIKSNEEKLYSLLKELGLGIIGISGPLYYNFDENEEPDGDTYTNYLVKYLENDKEDFIKKSIIYIEKEIKGRTKGFTVKKLKENLLADILILDIDYGTEGKSIDLEKIDKNILLLLHLDNKIIINDYNSKTIFNVDIMTKETVDEEANPDPYYTTLKETDIEEVKEEYPILIYENLQLISRNGKPNITVKSKQKLLCDIIFSTGFLKNNTYTFSDIEDNIYDREKQNIETIKSLIKNIKSKLTKLGYENIIEYTSEILIIKRTT